MNDRSKLPWPPGDSHMAALVRTHNWTVTPLGPVDCWPQSLRTTVELVLAGGFPMAALWGPDLVQIYDDGYQALMGLKHLEGLGHSPPVAAGPRCGTSMRRSTRGCSPARRSCSRMRCTRSRARACSRTPGSRWPTARYVTRQARSPACW